MPKDPVLINNRKGDRGLVCTRVKKIYRSIQKDRHARFGLHKSKKKGKHKFDLHESQKIYKGQVWTSAKKVDMSLFFTRVKKYIDRCTADMGEVKESHCQP